MKRLIISLATAIALGTSASAQNYLLENPENHAYFGARLGLDITSTAGAISNDYSNGAGFTLGAIYNIPVVKNFYFEPGLHMFYDTFGEEIGVGIYEGIPEVANISLRNFGFRIPFNFGYRFDFTDDMSIYLFTGPVLNLNVTAKAHLNGIDHYEGYSHSIFDNGFKRTDFQWDFGVGYSYGKMYTQIGGSVGITKVYKTAVENFRRNNFNISIGYNF